MAKYDKSIFYTRAMIANVVQVNPQQLRTWNKSSNSELFKLPRTGNHPIHKRSVIASLEKTRKRIRGLIPLTDVPEGLFTAKDIQAHYGISKATLRGWINAGCPCYIFSERIIRYLTEELDAWYTVKYGK